LAAEALDLTQTFPWGYVPLCSAAVIYHVDTWTICPGQRSGFVVCADVGLAGQVADAEVALAAQGRDAVVDTLGFDGHMTMAIATAASKLCASM
jgi:hypothetical protein